MELVNYPVFFVRCDICKHHIEGKICKAFPSGIPKELHNKLHTEKLPTQKNDIVFEMGEEGSKNAGIKPISGIDKMHAMLGKSKHEQIAKLREGEIEEEYREKTEEKVLS